MEIHNYENINVLNKNTLDEVVFKRELLMWRRKGDIWIFVYRH